MSKFQTVKKICGCAFLASIVSCTNVPAADKSKLESPISESKKLEMKFSSLLGKSGNEIVTELKISSNDCSLTDEPPMVLRGASFKYENGYITLYIAEGENLFRKFFLNGPKPTCSEILNSKVGGIQLMQNGKNIWVGAAVPFQWRI